MNKSRQEMILHIWEQFEMGKAMIDREYVIRSQELLVQWAKDNDVDLTEITDMDALHEKLKADESMVETSSTVAAECQAKFHQLLFEQLVPAIDQSKVDCKDGIITPDDLRGDTGAASPIITL